MQLSRHLRGPYRFLSFDNICWQCRCHIQQRSHSSKTASDNYGIFKKGRKVLAFRNKVYTKNAAAFCRVGISSTNVRTRYSKGAAGRSHSYGSSQESEVGKQISSLPLEDSLYLLGAKANSIYKTVPSNGSFIDMSLEGQRHSNTVGQQTHRDRLFSIIDPNQRFLGYSQAYSARENIRYALQGKSALHQENLGVYSPNIGQRTYSTATAAATSVHVTTNEYPANQNELIQPPDNKPTKISIRERLQIWQNEQEPSAYDFNTLDLIEDRGIPGQAQNTFTRPPSDNRASDAFGLGEADGYVGTPSHNEDNVPELGASRTFFRPGDLVDLRLFGSSTPAIFLRNIEEQQIQLYTARGKLVNMTGQKIYFSIPGFLSRSAVLRLLPYIPRTKAAVEDLDKMQAVQVPRDVGAPLIDAMLKFSRDADEEYRKHVDYLDNAFNIMTRQTASRYATTLEIAMEALKEPDASKISSPLLYAVHRALLNDEIGFHLDFANHRVTGLFEIIPKREVDLIRQVRVWLRQYQEALVVVSATAASAIHKNKETRSLHKSNPFPSFLLKTRKIVLKSRKCRMLTEEGFIGLCDSSKYERPQWSAPSDLIWVTEAGETFTEQEALFLRFLDYWAVQQSLMADSPISSLGPLILRATGLYEGFQLDEKTGFTFLQELGVITPWQNRVNSDRRLALPGQNTDITTDRLMGAAKALISTWKPEDSMKSLRRDWEGLDVFCIDRAESIEIDDGVSLEEIQDNPMHFWVHIHVANPTSGITPDHPMAQYAAHLTETVYLPEKRSYMLSPAITQGWFSLANGRPSLTFSAKLTMNGEILDTKVTSGIVRNVQYLTPQSVESALADKLDSSCIPKNITVGALKEPPQIAHHVPTKLTASQVTTLRKLQQLGRARRVRRQEQGSASHFFNNPEPSVFFNTLSHGLRTQQWPKYSSARLWVGDPVISMDYHPWDPIIPLKSPDDPEINMLVPDLMILACEIAAHWCSQRNIPVLYRGTEINPELPSPSRFKEEVMDASAKKHGYIHILLLQRYLSLIGRSKTMSEPLKHTIIGSDAYTKVTSPLRRYGDMIAHWQIEAAIRHEAETGKSLIGSTDTSYLPFSCARVDALLPRLSGRERLISTAKRNSIRHWTYMLMLRAFYFKEAELPSTFRIFITENLSARINKRGILHEFGIEATLFEDDLTKSEGGAQEGDWWECKIKTIAVYQRLMVMQATRLLERSRGETWSY